VGNTAPHGVTKMKTFSISEQLVRIVAHRPAAKRGTPAATNTNATIVTVGNGVFSMWSMRRCYNQDGSGQVVSCKSVQ
jgi:hypothetical protein